MNTRYYKGGSGNVYKLNDTVNRGFILHMGKFENISEGMYNMLVEDIYIRPMHYIRLDESDLMLELL